MQSPYNNISCSCDNFLALNCRGRQIFRSRFSALPPAARKQRRIHKPQATGVYLLTPADLVIPEDHKDVENEIRYYLHVILTSINNRKHEIEGWARINRELMQSIVGNPVKERKARNWLLENHIMGTEFSYSTANHVSAVLLHAPRLRGPHQALGNHEETAGLQTPADAVPPLR